MNLLKQIACYGSTQVMMPTSRKRANQHNRDAPVAVRGVFSWLFSTGSLADEALFHELVHAFRMASGKSTDATHAPFTRSGLSDCDNEEEFIAVLVTNIYISDPPNKPASTLRRDHHSFGVLERLSFNLGLRT